MSLSKNTLATSHDSTPVLTLLATRNPGAALGCSRDRRPSVNPDVVPGTRTRGLPMRTAPVPAIHHRARRCRSRTIGGRSGNSATRLSEDATAPARRAGPPLPSLTTQEGLEGQALVALLVGTSYGNRTVTGFALATSSPRRRLVKGALAKDVLSVPLERLRAWNEPLVAGHMHATASHLVIMLPHSRTRPAVENSPPNAIRGLQSHSPCRRVGGDRSKQIPFCGWLDAGPRYGWMWAASRTGTARVSRHRALAVIRAKQPQAECALPQPLRANGFDLAALIILQRFEGWLKIGHRGRMGAAQDRARDRPGSVARS